MTLHRGRVEPTESAQTDQGMQIVDLKAYPVSVRVENGAKLAIGRAIKRDAIVVKVTTALRDRGI